VSVDTHNKEKYNIFSYNSIHKKNYKPAVFLNSHEKKTEKHNSLFSTTQKKYEISHIKSEKGIYYEENEEISLEQWKLLRIFCHPTPKYFV
jgi:hypothetical protein